MAFFYIMIDFKKVQKNARKINQKLSSKLLYHNAKHGEEVKQTLLCLLENQKVTAEEQLLLQTAALYHDIGFTVRYEDNEPEAVKIVERELPALGYTPKQIQIISHMILATKIPQNPKTTLEKLLCDADLDNLGRPDFFKKMNLLWKEMQNFGIRISKKEWALKTLEMMQAHCFFTRVSKKLRHQGKENNLRLLTSSLSSLTTTRFGSAERTSSTTGKFGSAERTSFTR
jgi:exopolyphosphatase/pppGpp-phosphohydrolase